MEQMSNQKELSKEESLNNLYNYLEQLSKDSITKPEKLKKTAQELLDKIISELQSFNIDEKIPEGKECFTGFFDIVKNIKEKLYDREVLDSDLINIIIKAIEVIENFLYDLEDIEDDNVFNFFIDIRLLVLNCYINLVVGLLYKSLGYIIKESKSEPDNKENKIEKIAKVAKSCINEIIKSQREISNQDMSEVDVSSFQEIWDIKIEIEKILEEFDVTLVTTLVKEMLYKVANGDVLPNERDAYTYETLCSLQDKAKKAAKKGNREAVMFYLTQSKMLSNEVKRRNKIDEISEKLQDEESFFYQTEMKLEEFEELIPALKKANETRIIQLMRRKARLNQGIAIKKKFLEMVEEEDNKRNIQYLSKIKKAQEKEFEEILSIID